jgi:NADH:ubiquinone oxidoreductase subunit E
VKASVRKEVEQLLSTLKPRSRSSGEVLGRLQEAFKQKGVLSKRELKELASLQASLTQAA